jgi:PAS domain S-box-containing protein
MHVGDLLALASRVVGERHARRSFFEQAQSLGRELQSSAPADRPWVQFTERLLAASIGAASARLLLTSLLRGSGMDLGEVVAVLDEAGQELRFNREILSTTLENISAGVSVVDPDMRLTAWNRRYQDMFGYPDGMLYVGRPVADLIRYNAERGELGEGDIEVQINRRIGYMRAGSPHVFERTRSDGKVIEMRGQALPGGGYVTSYNDITDYKHAEKALLEANETLEQRVAERSHEAEVAQQSKTRFLAAISHDVLQPLNAARLFASALRDSDHVSDEQKHLAERVDASLRAAEELLDGLLDVSRLDAGGLHPVIGEFDVSALMRELAAQYTPVAAGRGLRLDLFARPAWVRSDRRLLRRVLQNFLANALRYTRQGRIVLACASAATKWSCRCGIPAPAFPSTTCGRSSTSSTATSSRSTGASRAWAWACRSASASRACSTIASTRAAGSARARCSRSSCRGWPAAGLHRTGHAGTGRGRTGAQRFAGGLRVLCVDNDEEILDGMRALLGRWQVQVITAATVDQALEKIAERPGDAGGLPPARPHGWPGRAGGPARSGRLPAAGRAADRRWPRRAEADGARARLPRADQADQAGLAARLPAPRAACRGKIHACVDVTSVVPAAGRQPAIAARYPTPCRCSYRIVAPMITRITPPMISARLPTMLPSTRPSMMPTVTMVSVHRPMTAAITPICTSMKARPIPTAIASMLVAKPVSASFRSRGAARGLRRPRHCPGAGRCRSCGCPARRAGRRRSSGRRLRRTAGRRGPAASR